MVRIGPLSYPLCFVIPLMSVIDKVLKYRPDWENQRQHPQIEPINLFFCRPHASQANINYAKTASMNQHPPAHQLRILSTGWGGISHLMVECALPFPLVFFLAGFFFPNFEISRPATYYLPSWPYRPTKNQLPPPLSPTYYIHTSFSHLNLSCHSYLPTQHLHNINGNQ